MLMNDVVLSCWRLFVWQFRLRERSISHSLFLCPWYDTVSFVKRLTRERKNRERERESEGEKSEGMSIRFNTYFKIHCTI